MPTLRSLGKSFAVRLLGSEPKPHYIIRGLAAGYRISVSPAENLSYIVGTAETHLQRVIRRFVSKGDTVYDIGANVGYVSLSLAKRVGPAGLVVAFEPVPQNLQSLRENIALNHLQNVRVFEVAASDRLGEATIRIAGNLSTASLVWHTNDESATKLSVRTEPIDELVASQGLSLPTFVKIDVEGAEGQVLMGMRRTLEAAKPVFSSSVRRQDAISHGPCSAGSTTDASRRSRENRLLISSNTGIPISFGCLPTEELRSA